MAVMGLSPSAAKEIFLPKSSDNSFVPINWLSLQEPKWCLVGLLEQVDLRKSWFR